MRPSHGPRRARCLTDLSQPGADPSSGVPLRGKQRHGGALIEGSTAHPLHAQVFAILKFFFIFVTSIFH